MESNRKILCILVVYFLQFSLPVQSQACTTPGTDCSGKGICDTVDADKCQCDEGFGGIGCATQCAETTCACTTATTCVACSSPVCNAIGGTCKAISEVVGAAASNVVRCVCNPGFAGEATGCDKCATDVGCHSEGTCNAGTGVCVCNPTHTGTYCERLTKCGNTTCDLTGSDGTCDTGVNKCKCNTGYITLDCSRLEKCGTNTCDLTGGDGTCTGDKCDCNDGYTGDDCSSLASSLLVTWAILILGVWSAIKLY